MKTNEIILETAKVSSIANIRCIKGEDNIIETHSSYLQDESKMSKGNASSIYFPNNEEEISSIIKHLNAQNIEINISGARTGIVGGAVPEGGVVISLENMSNVIGIGYDTKEEKPWIRVEPGLSLQSLNDKLSKIVTLKNEFEFGQECLDDFLTTNNEYFYPVDPTELTASIGGTVSTNASGAASFKYGPTRKWVKRIRVVLPDGNILDIPRGKYFASDENQFIIKSNENNVILDIPSYKMPNVKNAAGIYAEENMDLIDLFIGSEGLFGVISEIDLWFIPKNPVISTILFFHKEKDAVDFVKELKHCKEISPDFIEFVDNNGLKFLRNKQNEDPKAFYVPLIFENAESAIFFDFPYKENTFERDFEIIEKLALKCNTSLDFSWSAETKQEIKNFKMFRHALPETVNALISHRKKEYPDLHKLGTDMSVNDDCFNEILSYYHEVLQEEKLDYVIFGHIGDNHVHVNILPKNYNELKRGKEVYKLFAEKVLSLGGSISAEHGIGKLKRDYLLMMYGQKGIYEVTRIKKAIDPKSLFCLGNMINIK